MLLSHFLRSLDKYWPISEDLPQHLTLNCTIHPPPSPAFESLLTSIYVHLTYGSSYIIRMCYTHMLYTIFIFMTYQLPSGVNYIHVYIYQPQCNSKKPAAWFCSLLSLSRAMKNSWHETCPCQNICWIKNSNISWYHRRVEGTKAWKENKKTQGHRNQGGVCR